MKKFFYLLLIGIAILGLSSGFNNAYADKNSQVDLANGVNLEKIIQFVQKYGYNVSEDGKINSQPTGREIMIGLGWEQNHPELTKKIPYHFLVKGVEVHKISGETKVIFHQLWLSPDKAASFENDPQFKGLKESDLFFKRISTYLVNDNLNGKILWVFYYRDNLREIDPLSSAEALEEFLTEYHWWIDFIDNFNKK